MTRRGLFPLCLVLAVCCLAYAVSGCVNLAPELTGTPTPSSSPTPLPDAFAPVLTAAPLPTDQLGKTVETDDHYYYYLSFGDLRVYEYDTSTYLDGVCVNAYPQALDGALEIVFRNDDGVVCGSGRIHNADGGTLLQTGTNNIYAEINTDVNVCEMAFTFEIKTQFAPVAAEDKAA